jgi:hypothetical protein
MLCLVTILLLAIIATFVVLCEQRRVAAFNKRFPPTDDDEFVRRCGPGVRRETALRVRRIIAEQLGIEYEQVYPEQSFANDLGCD